MPTGDVRRRIRTVEVRIPDQARSQASPPLSVLIERWLTEKIITPEQATQMLRTARSDVQAPVAAPPARSHRDSVVVEALGYLGGAIAVTASMLIAGTYWDDLGGGWRLVVLGATTLALLIGGAVVPESTAVGGRLRGALWLGSTASAAGSLAVVAVDLLELHGIDVAALVATGTAVYASALWFRSRGPLQQLAMMVSIGVAASTLIAQTGVPDSVPGLGAWAVGLGWATLGWLGMLKPPWFGLALGSAMTIVGAMTTASADAGMVLTLVTVLAVIAAAMSFRNLLLLGVGTIGLLVNLPGALTRWFPDSPAAPYVLLVVGLLTVLAAVRVGRHARDEAGHE